MSASFDLQTLPAGAFIGALGGDGSTDATVAVNPCLRRILGYAPEQPQAALRPFAPSRFADPAARAGLLTRLAAHSAVTDHLLQLVRLDGSTVWVEVTAFARPADDAGRWHVDAIVRDVSERKALDDRSRDLDQQMRHADRMTALGQTIAGVAHELNNPLATILSWAERLAEQPLDDAAARGVGVIVGEAERAARIVRNLLTFARKRQSTRAMVDVSEVVAETLALRANEHRIAGLTVRHDRTEGVPDVFADAHQVQQVVVNLVINAEQAMCASGEGSRLVVRSFHTLDRGGLVVIEVEDDGPGVPVEIRQRIFDPFFTTKEVGHGTGLGLTVSHAIVQEHGGQLTVTDAPGGGARFRVELPSARAGSRLPSCS